MLTALKLTAALQLTTKLLTDGKVRVTQSGNRPSVQRDRDGNVLSVNIPVIPSEPSKDFLAALHGFLDQEVAGVLFTDPKQLRSRKEAAVAELSPALIPRFETLLGLIERVRVERMMTIQFEGSLRNLNNALDFLMNGEVKARLADMLASEEKDGLISEILPLWLRAAAGSAFMKLFLKENGLEAFSLMLTSSFPTIEDRMQDLPSSGSSVALALDIIKSWDEQTKKDEPEPMDGEEAEKKPADSKDDDTEGNSPEKGDDGSEATKNDPDDDDLQDEEGDGGSGDDDSGDEGDDSGDSDGDGEGDGGEGEGSDSTDGEGSDEHDGDDDGGDSDEGKQGDNSDRGSGGDRRQAALTDALLALTKEQRNVMFDLKNNRLSYEKIAERRGLSVEDVKKTVLEARKTLNQTYRERKAA